MFSTASASCALIGALAGAVLSAFIFRRRNHTAEVEPHFIDRSGITGNRATNFVDVWAGKVINIRFDKWVITFNQIPAPQGINYLSILSQCNQMLKKSVIETEGKVTNIDQKTFALYYSSIVEIIFQLTKSHVKKLNQAKYKKALIKHARENVAWTLDVVEHLIDYWTMVKKKLEILSNGSTLMQTVGGAFTWHSLELDGQGQICIKPRYVKS
jgi:hypothetical protein